MTFVVKFVEEIGHRSSSLGGVDRLKGRVSVRRNQDGTKGP